MGLYDIFYGQGSDIYQGPQQSAYNPANVQLAPQQQQKQSVLPPTQVVAPADPNLPGVQQQRQWQTDNPNTCLLYTSDAAERG